MDYRKLSSLFPLIVLATLIILSVYFFAQYLPITGFTIALVLIFFFFYAILLPIFSTLPYSFTYALCLPAPYFGLYFSALNWLNKHALNSYLHVLAVSFFSFITVSAFHYVTRKRSWIGPFELSDLGRVNIAGMSIMLLVASILLISPVEKLTTFNEVIILGAFWLGYVAFSMVSINITYRMLLLNEKLHTRNLNAKMEKLHQELKTKFPRALMDVELLFYYLRRAVKDFLIGNYESSFIWGYNAIREKTVVDPKLYVSDEFVGGRKFSDIRNTLMHSRRKGHTKVEDIKSIRRSLFDDNLQLLERAFLLVDRITS